MISFIVTQMENKAWLRKSKNKLPCTIICHINIHYIHLECITHAKKYCDRYSFTPTIKLYFYSNFFLGSKDTYKNLVMIFIVESEMR